jgi:hypothetical protein
VPGQVKFYRLRPQHNKLHGAKMRSAFQEKTRVMHSEKALRTKTSPPFGGRAE